MCKGPGAGHVLTVPRTPWHLMVWVFAFPTFPATQLLIITSLCPLHPPPHVSRAVAGSSCCMGKKTRQN